ncbi:MAG TPA: hypothetical protein VMT36_05000 [Candidatus Saccharimonadia bacterium]|nr:hypothetical protein [Candidatus Saccharimonadia bacterium]
MNRLARVVGAREVALGLTISRELARSAGRASVIAGWSLPPIAGWSLPPIADGIVGAAVPRAVDAELQVHDAGRACDQGGNDG